MDVTLSIPCVTIKDSQAISRSNMQQMLLSGVENVFVVDIDAINKNRFNFKIYQELSKYFEITVMSLPLRVEDLMDSYISGASEIVIPGRISQKLLEEYMRTSESLVLLYQDPYVAQAYYLLGGRTFVSDRQLDFNNARIYSFSKILKGPGYITLTDFPAEELGSTLR